MEKENKFEQLTERTRGGYKAFLYDCDGTLADNMQAHKDTYAAIALKQGVTIDPAIIDEFAGLPIPAVVVEINKRYNSHFDPAAFETQKSALFYNEYIGQTKPISFVVDHLKASAGKHRVAVVSGGSRKMIEKTLQVLGVDHLVEVLVCAGDTSQGKPHPDPFLLAAQQLNVPAKDCLVLEDGDAGVAAAAAAGMDWVRIDKM